MGVSLFPEAWPGERGGEGCPAGGELCELQGELLLVTLTGVPMGQVRSVSELETFAQLCPGSRRINANRFCCS